MNTLAYPPHHTVCTCSHATHTLSTVHTIFSHCSSQPVFCIFPFRTWRWYRVYFHTQPWSSKSVYCNYHFSQDFQSGGNLYYLPILSATLVVISLSIVFTRTDPLPVRLQGSVSDSSVFKVCTTRLISVLNDCDVTFEQIFTSFIH